MHNQRKNINMSRDQGQGERAAFALLRSCTLSAKEKNVMREELQTVIGRSRAVAFSWPAVNFSSFFSKRSFAVSVLSIVLIAESGLGVANAAERSLPGEVLYPVKINVNEPIIASLKRSDTARAEWEHERVARRLAEAEALAGKGKLGDVEKNEIEQQLSQNRETLDRIEQHDVTDDEFIPEQSKDVTKKIQVHFEEQGGETRIHIEEIDEKEESMNREIKPQKIQNEAVKPESNTDVNKQASSEQRDGGK